MILELATILVKEGSAKEFTLALSKAEKVLKQAQGYISHEFKQCIEEENKFILMIKWETLEAHTKGFRESELFQQWRTIIGSYFESTPNVVHYNNI